MGLLRSVAKDSHTCRADMPSSNDSETATHSERIIGFDVARSLAILGMILVHFGLVMSKDRTSPPALAIVLDILDGRAATLFVLIGMIRFPMNFETTGMFEAGNRALLNARASGFVKEVNVKPGDYRFPYARTTAEMTAPEFE